MKAARLYRDIRSHAVKTALWQPHLPHTVQLQEGLDPSLSNRLVYGNRADWYAAAAVNGMFDVDVAVETGARRYPLPERIASLAHPQRKTGMSLYE